MSADLVLRRWKRCACQRIWCWDVGNAVPVSGNGNAVPVSGFGVETLKRYDCQRIWCWKVGNVVLVGGFNAVAILAQGSRARAFGGARGATGAGPCMSNVVVRLNGVQLTAVVEGGHLVIPIAAWVAAGGGIDSDPPRPRARLVPPPSPPRTSTSRSRSPCTGIGQPRGAGTRAKPFPSQGGGRPPGSALATASRRVPAANARWDCWWKFLAPIRCPCSRSAATGPAKSTRRRAARATAKDKANQPQPRDCLAPV